MAYLLIATTCPLNCTTYLLNASFPYKPWCLLFMLSILSHLHSPDTCRLPSHASFSSVLLLNGFAASTDCSPASWNCFVASCNYSTVFCIVFLPPVSSCMFSPYSPPDWGYQRRFTWSRGRNLFTWISIYLLGISFSYSLNLE